MILKNDIPKTFSYTRMILYNLEHFKALQLHFRAHNVHSVNVNTTLHFFEEKKNPADEWGREKKNILQNI